jgi:mannosyltransferase
MSSRLREERGAATETASDSHSGASGSLLLWGIVLAGAILRLIALGRKSFWLDEIASVAIARRPWPVFWHFLWHDEGNMALYYVALKPWLHFGYGESTVRLLSVVPGVLSIPLMYALGARLLGRQVGILASLLLAVNTCAVGVSQEARAYSFLVLFVLLSSWLFVRLIEAPGYWAAVVYAAIAGVTCYVHYFGVLVPAAHAVSVFGLPANRRPWRPLILAWAIVALLAAPVLWLIHAQDVGHISWLQPPSWLELYHLGVFLAADGGKAVGAVLLVLELVCVGLFGAALRRVWRDTDCDLKRWPYSLIASMVFTPVILTLLVSIVRPAFYHRFLIICLPGWLLVVAVSVLQLRARAWRIGAISAVCAISLTTTGLFYVRQTEDWRDGVTYLMANARPDDRVLYFQSVGQFAGESYRDWRQPSNAARPQTFGISAANSDWERDLDHADRLWLVLYRVKEHDAEALTVQQKLSKRYEPGPGKIFQGVTVIEYTRR